MRLWHKDLIPYLPRQQLLAQWRECCCIARNIFHDGTPNHLLVNKVLDYPDEEFNTYANMVYEEMMRRYFSVNSERFLKWRKNRKLCYHTNIFKGWHNDRYLRQCLANLEEKYDCGGIPGADWELIKSVFRI